MKMQHNTTLEDSFVFLTKLSIVFPYSTAIVLVSIYPKELKTYVHKITYMQMFVANLLIIVKTEGSQEVLQ